MNIDQLYPSTFLKAADLGTSHVQVTISKITLEDMGDKEMKPVLHFLGKDKGLVLNKTNGFLCAEAYGKETDAWLGKPLVLYSQKVNFQGRMVDGIAVMAAQTAVAPPVVQFEKPVDMQPTTKGQMPVEQSAGHQPQPGNAGQQMQQLADDIQQEKHSQIKAEFDPTVDIPF